MNGRKGDVPITASAGIKDNMKSRDNKTIELDMDMDPGNPDDQAYIWISRLATGESDAKSLAAFECWRDSDVRHERALVKARKLWLMMGGALEEQYAPAMASMPIASSRHARHPWRPLFATAATVLLAFGIGQQWHANWRYDEVSAKGEQRAIALSDGSTMWLNTDSAADIEINASTRRVTLARGEAYFDVARDAGRPFVIEAGLGQVRVLGTAFGVYRDGDETVVTVQRGRVEVADQRGHHAELTPDQSIRIKRNGMLERVSRVDASRELAWRTGRVMFENRPIGQVFDELRRYDRRVIVVSYPRANHLRVSSMVDLARLDEWYDTLSQSMPIEVKRFGPVVWINEVKERSHQE